MIDFSIVENLFRQFLPALREVFSASELAEVSGFIDVGEYGLALDTAVDIFVEEKKVATQSVIGFAERLAVAMDLSVADYADRLRAAGSQRV